MPSLSTTQLTLHHGELNFMQAHSTKRIRNISPTPIRYVSLVVAFCALASGCSNAESDAQIAVRARLKDPDSAEFGQFTAVNDNAGCLTVNARNSMGGYTGDKQASLIRNGGNWTVVDMSSISHEQCLDVVRQSCDRSESKCKY